MKTPRVVVGLIAGVVGLATVLVASPARAGRCRLACALAKGVCSNTAAQAYRACKKDCLGAGSVRECTRACRDEFRAARVTCKTALGFCRNECPIENPCVRGCGADAVGCLRQVKNGLKICARGCVRTARDAARQCPRGPERRQCLIQVGAQLASCLRACAGTARTGATACIADLRTCIRGCRGSVSGAFLAPHADCLR